MNIKTINMDANINIATISTPGLKKIAIKMKIQNPLLPQPVETYAWRAEASYMNSLNNEWLLPNNPKFPDWINDKFYEYRLNNETVTESDIKKTLFLYQKFIQNYIAPWTPYRGILAFHKLGSGKTRTAIATAEPFRKAGFKVIVMLPASLTNNFIDEVKSWANSDLAYPDGYTELSLEQQKTLDAELSKKIKLAYQFISYNANNAIKQLKKVRFVNSIIIIDEVHNLLNMMTSTQSKQGKAIYHTLMGAKNCRFIALSGTPLLNFSFELGLLFNILRGYMSEPCTNMPATNGVEASIPLFPEDEVEFEQYFVDYITEKARNVELFKRRITGLVSYYCGVQEDLYPDLVLHEPERINMSSFQFTQYWQVRQDERATETKGGCNCKYSLTNFGEGKMSKSHMQKSKKFLVSNTFRPNSRQYCNFTFPDGINRPKSLSKATKEVLSKVELDKDPEKWNEEQLSELYTLFQFQQINNDKEKEESEVTQVETETQTETEIEQTNAVKELATEKELAIEKEQIIQKETAIKDTKAAQIIHKEIKIEKEIDVDWEAYNDFVLSWSMTDSKKDCLQLLIETIESRGFIGKFNHIVNRQEETLILSPESHDMSIKRALIELTACQNVVLNKKNLSTYSAKMAKMFENMTSGEGCGGKKFIYSNFRTLEGVEIFSRVLQVNGYELFNPNSTNHSLEKGLRFAIISGTESPELRRNILKAFNRVENAHGEYIMVILGTSSAAEGISLKHVRQIHIMEPWWNEVRVKQVIGRGRRIGSHLELPEAERNVHVYQYLSVLSDAQKAVLKKHPKEHESTDEHVFNKAQSKARINSQFIHILMEAAVDSVLNSAHNQNLRFGIKPMTIGKWVKYMFIPSIQKEECMSLTLSQTTTDGSSHNYSAMAYGHSRLAREQPTEEDISEQQQSIKFVDLNLKAKGLSDANGQPLYVVILDDTNKYTKVLIHRADDPKKLTYPAYALYDKVSAYNTHKFLVRAYLVDKLGLLNKDKVVQVK